MSTPNFEIVQSTIVLISRTPDADKVADLQSKFNNTVDDDFLRRVEAEIKRAQSSSSNANSMEQLDALLKTSEARRACIIAARNARDSSSKTSDFDKTFSEKLNSDIQYVGETTDQATLTRLLTNISTSRDLQSLQNAVKKLNDVKNTVSLQPGDASFVRKGLSSRDWNVKLQQIGTALQTRMNDLSKEQSAARNAPLVVGDCAGLIQGVGGGAGGAETPYEFFMRLLWLWVALFIIVIILIVLAAVYLRPKLVSKANVQPPVALPLTTNQLPEDPQLQRHPVTIRQQ